MKFNLTNRADESTQIETSCMYNKEAFERLVKQLMETDHESRFVAEDALRVLDRVHRRFGKETFAILRYSEGELKFYVVPNCGRDTTDLTRFAWYIEMKDGGFVLMVEETGDNPHAVKPKRERYYNLKELIDSNLTYLQKTLSSNLIKETLFNDWISHNTIQALFGTEVELVNCDGHTIECYSTNQTVIDACRAFATENKLGYQSF